MPTIGRNEPSRRDSGEKFKPRALKAPYQPLLTLPPTTLSLAPEANRFLIIDLQSNLPTGRVRVPEIIMEKAVGHDG
jgi:hypothetical protein